MAINTHATLSPLTSHPSLIITHAALTKHTWGQQNDALRHEAPGSTGTYKRDIFAFSDPIHDVPHESETSYSFDNPKTWEGRIQDRTIIHFGAGTRLSAHTYLGTTRPILGLSSSDQAAVEELHAVCAKMHPLLPDLTAAFQAYQTGGTTDGFVTSAGFLSVCSKCGLSLERSEFLAIERSVTKENGGRLSWHQALDLVSSISASGSATTTAPVALELSQSIRSPLGTLTSPM